MKEDNRRAKLVTMGIAVVLILMVCGVSVIIHTLRRGDAVRKEGSTDSGSKLQADIMEYADTAQEQGEATQGAGVTGTGQGGTAQEQGAATPEIIVEPERPSQTGQQEGERGTATSEGQGKRETGNASPTAAGEPAGTQAGKPEAASGGTADSQRTTDKWQKEVGEDLSAVKTDLPRQMSEMKGYWEAGNMKAVEDLAYLPWYRAASGKLSGTAKYYYFGDTDEKNRPNGKGLAMYTDNQYYYGDWVDGVRSGGGMWVKFYVYDKNARAKDSLYLQHSYSGSWENDLPNGDGAEHYDFIDGNLEENTGYNRNFIGNFRNGLYDGEIYITNYYKDGNVKEWSGTAVNGVWQSMGAKDKTGRYPVIMELTNPDNYQWMKASENKNKGVDGLISAAK